MANYFTSLDYAIFGLMLLFTAAIGIYFGFFVKSKNTTVNYLLGDKKMKIIPMGCSLAATIVSGFNMLGVPSDVYRYGAFLIFALMSSVLSIIIQLFIILPVYFNSNVTTTYEYLEKRFDKRTRKFGSFLFIFMQFLFLPIVVYIPSMALSAGTGIDSKIIIPIIYTICVFYTSAGGIKAVVWTDTLQLFLMMLSLMIVSVVGISSIGGISVVIDKSLQGQRFDIFNFSLDPTEKDTFWSVFIGVFLTWLFQGVHQANVLKYLSVPTLRDARLTGIVYYICWLTLHAFLILIGLVVYAKYSDCDPISSKIIKRYDQLIPYFVMDEGKNIPGLTGLFISGLFSASLSTLSGDLNSLGGTVYEDFLKNSKTEKHPRFYMKIIIIVIGIILYFMSLLVEKIGGILPLVIAFVGVPSGPLVSLFLLGMFSTKINVKGVFYGGILSVIFSSFILVMNKYYEMSGLIVYAEKPFSIEGCPFSLNISKHSNQTAKPPYRPWAIFRLSYYYYGPLGILVTMIFAIIISYFTGFNRKSIHKNLLTPVIHFTLPKELPGNDKCSKYCKVSTREK